MKHPDWFNNLILISPCVRGLETAPPEIVRGILTPRLGDEKVSKDLVDRWTDPAFQRKLKEFVANFRKSGKRIIVIRSEDDLLSSPIEGAEEILLRSSEKASDVAEAHGRPLKDKRVAEFIAEAIGNKITS